MWRTGRLALLLLSLLTQPVLAFLAQPAWAQDHVVHLASLEWPPYTSAKDGHGGSDAVVRAAFAAAGYDVSVTYLPWQRAMLAVRHDPKTDGVFPAYAAQSRDAYCQWSAPIGHSPLGFVERADAPIRWSNLDDLAGVPLGTVQGYANTADFDAMTQKGDLKVETATDDSSNLRKLLVGRIRAAVIDRNVMRYLLSSEPSLRSNAGQLQFNDHLLENKPLYVCFRKDQGGAVLAGILNDDTMTFVSHSGIYG